MVRGKRPKLSEDSRAEMVTKSRIRMPSRWGEIAPSLPAGARLTRGVQEQKILDSWEEVVGKDVAEQTRPTKVRNQMLEVKVSSSVWMQQLQFMKGLIIQKLGAKGSSVRDLRFFVGEIESGGEEETPKRSCTRFATLGEGEKDRIAREVAGIRDAEMREIFYRIYAQSLAAEKYRREE